MKLIDEFGANNIFFDWYTNFKVKAFVLLIIVNACWYSGSDDKSTIDKSRFIVTVLDADSVD